MQQSRQGYTQVQQFFIKQSYEVIFLSHYTIGDIVSVEFGCRRVIGGCVCWRRGVPGRNGSDGIFFANRANAADNFRPGNGLYVSLERVEQGEEIGMSMKRQTSGILSK